MCTDKVICAARLDYDMTGFESPVSPVQGLTIAHDAMSQVQALPDWDARNFINTECTSRGISILVRGEATGHDIAKLLLPGNPCITEYSLDERHWRAWRGIYAGTGLSISTNWPATPPTGNVPGRLLERHPSPTSKLRPHGPRRG